jgi:peptidoglycan DL-endopeptidase LytE
MLQNLRNFKMLFVLLLLVSVKVFSQEKPIKHKIAKGETITSIAKQYNIKPNVIYDLNPNARKVLRLNSVLLIPALNLKKETESEIIVEKIHEVKPKESLYRIAKQYKISIDDLKKWNPSLETENLSIGQILFVTENKTSKTTTLETEKSAKQEFFIYEVVAKETKYSLSKKFETTIEDLEKWNPEIVNSLAVGFKLKIFKPKIENDKINSKVEPDTTPKVEPEKEIIADVKEAIEQPNDSITVAKPITNIDLAENLAQRGSENIGARYRPGGTKPGGFDCSGLMMYIFENSEIKLPRTSAGQSNFGVRIDSNDAQKGDLIFFSTNGSRNINHVGMVVENTDGEVKFIHASIHSGVTISSLKEKYYERCFVKINRVLE